MRQKALLFLVFCIFFTVQGTAEVESLSQLFLLGKGIKDLDNDGHGDRVALRILIPDAPAAHELALAGDIAARANLESLVVDFSLLRKDSDVRNILDLELPILIGSRSSWAKKWEKEAKTGLPSLGKDQGLVLLSSHRRRPLIICAAGSERALLLTGRAFFLRWPYLWEIWGREQGATYSSVEKDLRVFLESQGIVPERIITRCVLYEFPEASSAPLALKNLDFNTGEIKELQLEIHLADKNKREAAWRALETLRLQHLKGEKTEVLNYPGCAQTTFLIPGNKLPSLTLRRMGFPKRILTPSYKTPFRPRPSGKNFDLLQLFTARGVYADCDKDGILDTVETSVILPRDSVFPGAALLASRLVLGTAGASFPLLYLDSEVEDNQSLISPILIGENNSLNKELSRKGKLKTPPLQKGLGWAGVVPEAFNASSALAIVGGDDGGVDCVLTYLSTTFPYLDEYGDGHPRLEDIVSDLEKFLEGENGSAEADFNLKIRKITEDLKGKELLSLKAELYLPRKNQHFEDHLRRFLEEFHPEQKAEVQAYELKDGKIIFEEEKEFPWEGDEAIRLIEENLDGLEHSGPAVKVSLGLSESPQVREKIKSRIEALLSEKGVSNFEIRVLSAYKQGFFWLLDEVLPSLQDKPVNRLLIRFAEERENIEEPKRFYSEPVRWLQELYPVDEIIAEGTGIPLERIEFEMKSEKEPVYEVLAFDEAGQLLLEKDFSPRTKEALYLKVIPEWGTVKLTTGWLRIEKGKETVLDTAIPCDLERFWTYYQEEVLPRVYSYVMKKTDNEPAFSKQPYFKRLLAEIWFSEPDYRLELDEEIISSLESIHDELYFDTLDFLRGITRVELEEREEAERDTSRHSAPGNILPIIHPSLEGGKGKARIVFEDWQAQKPQLILKWKEKGRDEYSKKIIFPALKADSFRIPSVIYNGGAERIENLFVETTVEKEAEYLTLIDLIESCRKLQEQGIIPPFRYPNLNAITLRIKYKELEKEEKLPVSSPEPEQKKPFQTLADEKPIVPTDEIISPRMCLEIVEKLGRSQNIRSYIAGVSYEKREIPVLEIFTPLDPYASLPRLITFKPTLYLSGRQHANEVSATNYLLKFAECLTEEGACRELVKRMNLVLHPMENPDGAELAYQLQKLTPFHSLHAGRYSSLGMDIGHQVGAAKPLLPEARIRKGLYEKWLPDIYLNLHGYPSHEWVQQFSNYSPYLFRDYWIPRGWFAYYQSLTLPIYQKWKEAGEELKAFIIEKMRSEETIHSSNQKFYDRYRRWASRWQPHLNYLELHDGVNLYARRRSSTEAKLTPRREITFVEETPELMDETARGPWLDFLCEKGLAYIGAHTEYLSRVQFEKVRLEEEIRGRVHVRFIRSRPGKVQRTP